MLTRTSILCFAAAVALGFGAMTSFTSVDAEAAVHRGGSHAGAHSGHRGGGGFEPLS